MTGDLWREQFDESPGYLDFARVGPPSRAVVEEHAALLGRVARAGMFTVDEFDDMLRSAGAEIVSAIDRRAGILAFRVPGRTAGEVASALADVEVTATVRPDQVRLSPHASTGPAAVERVRAALAHLTRNTA